MNGSPLKSPAGIIRFGQSALIAIAALCALWVRSSTSQPQTSIPSPADNRKLTLAYSTYLGSPDGALIRGMANDGDGDIYITGATGGPGFPTTPGVYQRSYAGGYSNAFVAKVNPEGKLTWCTLLGGLGVGDYYTDAVGIDREGSVFVSGRAAPGLPTTPGVFSPNFQGRGIGGSDHGIQNGFVAKFSSDGHRLTWASYVSNSDDVHDVKVGSDGTIYIVSGYAPSEHPDPPPASWFVNGYQKSPQPKTAQSHDVYVLRISSDGTRVLNGTYISGSGMDDWDAGLALDSQGNVYIGSVTTSPNMPTPNGYAKTNRGKNDFYIAKFSPDLSRLIYGTYLGGSGDESASTHPIAADFQGDAYVTMSTNSPDMPTTPGAYQRQLKGGRDIYVAKISAGGSQLLAATYLGGSGDDYSSDGHSVDAQGNLDVGLTTTSKDLAVTPDALQKSYGGGLTDTYIAKLSPDFTKLLYGSYVGGDGWDENRITMVDPAGNFYMAGDTTSRDFPTKNAYQSISHGGQQAFLMKYLPASPPTVQLNVDPTTFNAPAEITLRATASQPDGQIRQIDFYANDKLLGSSTEAPYTFVWRKVTAGGYFLRAVATGSLGAAAGSNSVEATVAGRKNEAPVIVKPAVGNGNPVSTELFDNSAQRISVPTSSRLSVLANDDGGESNLNYTWSVIGKPHGAPVPTFTSNGNNDAKNTEVTFAQAGEYYLQVTVTDQQGLSASNFMQLNGLQVPNKISIAPPNPQLAPNGSLELSAIVYDQFDRPMSPQPPLAWALTNGGGTITPSGSFTAGPIPGDFTIRVYGMRFGNVTGSAKVGVYPAAAAPQ